MTSERSGEQTSEIQLLIAVNPRMLKRRRNAEFWQICCLISLESLLISLYAILLSQQIATTPIQHELDQAALLIADEIGRLSIQDGRFGNVGLIEISEGTHSQLSLNKIQATLRVDAITANRLGLKTMEPLIEHDVIEAAKISRSLARHERAMAIPGGKESFFEIEDEWSSISSS